MSASESTKKGVGGRRSGSCSQATLSYDLFAEEFRFHLPDGRSKKPTVSGCMLTSCLFTLLVFYGLMQAMQLFQYDETDIMMSSRDSFFTADHVVNEGLMFAFGMTGFDDITESIEDPTIGQLKPYYKSWGILDEEAVDSDFEPLRYHTCTREELRLEDDPTTELPPSGTSTQFYPIKKEGTQVDLDYYYKKLKCLDQDQ